MQYQEFEVPESLRRYVHCAWRLHDPVPAGDPETIYPDGRCELMVHLADPMSMFELDRGWCQQSPTLFAGQLRAAIRLAARGEVDCVGVRLKPAASACALEGPPAKLRDRVVDLSRIDAEFSDRLTTAAQAFAAEPTCPALWQLLEQRLVGRRVDRNIESAVARLERDHGQTRIEALAEAEAMSLRSLQIRFLRNVGLSAKQFARVVRLQATIRALDAGTGSLADLALEAGFSDQSHATRDLARLTGLTPARLRAALHEQREDEATIRLAAAFVRGRGPDVD